MACLRNWFHERWLREVKVVGAGTAQKRRMSGRSRSAQRRRCLSIATANRQQSRNAHAKVPAEKPTFEASGLGTGGANAPPATNWRHTRY
jgi:hypothetical protein